MPRGPAQFLGEVVVGQAAKAVAQHTLSVMRARQGEGVADERLVAVDAVSKQATCGTPGKAWITARKPARVCG